MAACSSDPAAIYADFPETVEVMHDRSFDDLGAFLEGRDGYYDTIWVVRTHNLDQVRPILDRVVAGQEHPPQVVLDTEAIFAVRDALHEAVSNGQEAPVEDNAIVDEFRNREFCQHIIAVNESEAAILRRLVAPAVSVIGHIREVRPLPRSFDARRGVLFIGAIYAANSPNLDALSWFVQEVLPLIELELGHETRLTVAGYIAPHVSLKRFQEHSRVTLCGPVANTEALYDTHRVFVAPTRFAAGAPYKVYEAASFGLPVAATELLRSQMGWTDRAEIVTAGSVSPTDMAKAVLELYRDRVLWLAVREGAMRRLAEENGRKHYVDSLATLLGRNNQRWQSV